MSRGKAGSTLDEAIGSETARLRRARGWTQDDLRRELRDAGFAWWTTEMVKSHEKGRRRARLGDLVSLGQVFQVTLSDLVPEKPRWVHLSDRYRADTSRLRAWLGGSDGKASWPVGTSFGFLDQETTPEAEKEVREMSVILELAPTSRKYTMARRAESGRLERRIAERLGVHPRLVGATAAHLWGQSATEKRNALAGSRNLRHVVTKHLTAEIRSELERRGVKVKDNPRRS